MELMHIPLSELAIAKVNVRHGVKKADYKDLIPSIKERGILQPLLVRKNGRGYEKGVSLPPVPWKRKVLKSTPSLAPSWPRVMTPQPWKPH
jgi:ParB family transcriptional regulator, chromosome partitioning protein